jgi:galactose oxidase
MQKRLGGARAYRGLAVLTFCCVIAAAGGMRPASRHADGADHASASHDMAGMIEGPAPPSADPASPLPRSGWTVTAGDPARTDAATGPVVDDDRAASPPSRPAGGIHPVRRALTIDMHAHNSVSGLTYLPDRRPATGTVGRFAVSVSNDGRHWGAPVTTGTWLDDRSEKTAAFRPVTARFVRLTAFGARAAAPSAAGVQVLGALAVAARPPATASLPRAAWTIAASDQDAASVAKNVLDGNSATLWVSQRSPTVVALPHALTIDMHTTKTVAGLMYVPRSDGSADGNIGQYSVSVSADGVTWGPPVDQGAWPDDNTVKYSAFTPVAARFVRLTAITEAGGRGPWSSAAEIELLTPAPSAAAGGQWSAPIGFPLVPASAVTLPNNKLLVFAAVNDTSFNKTATTTRVAILDLATGVVSAATTINTNHQMFCVGMALMADGRLLINGGASDQATTIYDPSTNSWSIGPLMNVPRGYNGSTLLSTGQVFTVGGSWHDSAGGKNGEVFTPSGATGTWQNLPGVSDSNILTADPAGTFRADNHPWLFAVSGGGVFHAGPSRNMNWITTTGTGTITSAGTRGDSPDAMNGNAVMYDVGKILTLGGATAYGDAGSVVNVQATRRSYLIDISGGPSQPAVTTRGPDMAFPRAFSSSVVLPDGKVLVLGGEQHPEPFNDTGAALSPELWDPATNRFRTMSPAAIPRTYHSVAALLPDGRVFSGGGGLCGSATCKVNHLDGEIFTPPYLLKSDGTPRVRPVIRTAPASAAPGSTITVTATASLPKFALVRMSGDTHAVNNDQRRIPLVPTTAANGIYTLTIPADTGVTLPGNYMLFALNSSGTPSVAKIVNIR